MKTALRYLLSILFAQALLLATPAIQNKADAAEKAAKPTKLKLVKIGKQAKAKAAKTKTGIAFLSSTEIAKLPYNERLQYVKLLREAMVDVEKFQRTIKNPKSFYKSAAIMQDHDLYAFIMGKAAYAQLGDDQGSQSATNNRGGNCDDRCAYAGYVNEYERNSSGQCIVNPFRCQPSPRCSTGGRSRGYTCNFMVFGLQGGDACIDSGNRARSTTACYELSETRSREDGTRVQRATHDANEYFKTRNGVDAAVANISMSDLESPRAAEIIEELVNTMYSVDSYAQLLVISEIYRSKGYQIPVDGVNTADGSNQASTLRNIAGYISDFNNSIDELFNNYNRMCDQPLSQDVVDAIRSGRNIPRYTGAARRQEEARQTYLARTVAAQQTPNSRNTLQVPECLAFQQRFDRLARRVTELRRGLPIEDVPGEPTNPDFYVRSTGCPSSTYREESGIYQFAARCSQCRIAKVVHNNARNESERTFHPSEKWSSLLTTMAVACDMGREEGRQLDVMPFNQFFETYGSCEFDTYDWKPGDSRYDAQKQRWQQDRRFMLDTDKGRHRHESFARVSGRKVPQPDENDDFYNLYGISFAEAREVFCQKSTTAGRRSVQSAVNRFAAQGTRENNPASRELASCMRESLDMANRLFAEGQNNCLGSAPLSNPTAYQNFYNTEVGDAPAGNMIYEGASCRTSSYVEVDNNSISVGMLDANSTGPEAIRRYSMNEQMLSQGSAIRPNLACYSSDRSGCAPSGTIARARVTFQTACHNADLDDAAKDDRRNTRSNQ